MENKKILIVDDEEEARLYMANILEEMYPEMQIILASSPGDALYLMKKQVIDAILLDVEMPGMTGLEVLEKFRKEQLNIPVIFISAYKRAEYIQKALRLNAVDYIDKPVNPIELNNALKKAFLISDNQIIDIEKHINQFSNRIKLITAKGIMFLNPNEILLFKSQNRDAVAEFLDDRPTLQIKENIKSLSNTLSEFHFIQINRQYLVNLNYIKVVMRKTKCITLSKDDKTISPVFKKVLQQLIEN